MDQVEYFLTDMQRLFESSLGLDELRASANRMLAAFIGRAAIRGDQYAPLEEILGLLAEARKRLQAITVEGEARYLRVELLTELDKAIAEVRRSSLPGPSL
jgi:hypothetical protein